MAPEPQKQAWRPPEPDGLLLPQLFRVDSRRRETPDTFTLTMTPTGTEPAWHFAQGQFNMLTAFGIGEVPISISGDPSEPRRLIHTIRAVGAATRALCRLGRGDTLGVRGPLGTAWPVTAAEGSDLIIVAGGLGLAPVRPAIYQALANRTAYGRVELIYGARTPEDILYYHELER
jgi:NAD(P)H-flavin reductase